MVHGPRNRVRRRSLVIHYGLSPSTEKNSLVKKERQK